MIHVHKKKEHFNLEVSSNMEYLDKDKLIPGSTVFVAESSKCYVLNNDKQWIEINLQNTNSTFNENFGKKNIVYDGGSIDASDFV